MKWRQGGEMGLWEGGCYIISSVNCNTNDFLYGKPNNFNVDISRKSIESMIMQTTHNTLNHPGSESKSPLGC